MYGFFLEPVNPDYVPDYLKIIKSPMDFSTMRKKIENGEYKGADDFKNDFELIISNAKLYNAKDTIYWKSADKVHEAGLKLIERSEKQIEEEILNAEAAAFIHQQQGNNIHQTEDTDADSLKKLSISFSKRKDSLAVKEEDVDIVGIDTGIPLLRKQNDIHTRETSVDLSNSRAMTPIRTTTYKKKKKKVAETGVLYGPDGSLHTVGGVNDIETLLPMEHPFSDPPEITVTNSAVLPSAFFLNRYSADDFHHYKHFTHPAHFYDYGPFPTLGVQPPGAFYTTKDAAYIYPLFGDDRGEAYIKSLWDFIDDDDDGHLKDYIASKSVQLTRGAWKVLEQTLERKNEHLLGKPPSAADRVTNTEFGSVNAASIVDKLESK